MAKKEATGKSKQKENESTQDDSSETTKSERKTRGAKRQPELLSPKKTDLTARKRFRKTNLSDENILNVIDEGELQKRAAKVRVNYLRINQRIRD